MLTPRRNGAEVGDARSTGLCNLTGAAIARHYNTLAILHAGVSMTFTRFQLAFALFPLFAMVFGTELHAGARTESYGQPSSSFSSPTSIRIAVVSSQLTVNRLRGLGFKADLIQEADADPAKLKDYTVIYLPTGWAQQQNQLAHYDQLAGSFHQFIKRGGALIVGQPNPYQLPGNQCQPKMLPYPVTFVSPYNDKDKTRVNLGKNHFITKDLADDELPFPFDEMRQVDKHYQQLAKQKSTGICSLAVASFGMGRVVIHTASEGSGAKVPLPDRVLKRMVHWAARRHAP